MYVVTVVSSRTDPDDDVVDVPSFSALDVVEDMLSPSSSALDVVEIKSNRMHAGTMASNRRAFTYRSCGVTRSCTAVGVTRSCTTVGDSVGDSPDPVQLWRMT